jgi:hypothetical protein
MGVEKRRVTRGGKNIIFLRGKGINNIFGPKYRPLEGRKLYLSQNYRLGLNKTIQYRYIRS